MEPSLSLTRTGFFSPGHILAFPCWSRNTSDQFPHRLLKFSFLQAFFPKEELKPGPRWEQFVAAARSRA